MWVTVYSPTASPYASPSGIPLQLLLATHLVHHRLYTQSKGLDRIFGYLIFGGVPLPGRCRGIYHCLGEGVVVYTGYIPVYTDTGYIPSVYTCQLYAW